MPHRRSRLRLGTGLSLTRRDRALRGLGRDLVDRGLAGLHRVDLAGIRRRLDRADRHPVDRVVPADLVLRDPVDLAGIRRRLDRADRHPVDRVVLRDPVVRDPVDLAGIRRRLDRADRRPVDRVVLRDLAHRGALAVRVDIRDRVGLVDPVGLDLADRVDPAGRVDLGMNPVNLVDRHRRRTHPEARSNGVARRWAAPGMCRTASAPPITVRRRRLHNTDGVGMADRHRERRRLSGMDRRPRVAGTVHRLPVVGMSDGMGHRATKALRSAISGRSTTTGTTRSRCSTQCSGDGASGSSESGFRCTDTTPKLHGLRTLLTQVRRP